MEMRVLSKHGKRCEYEYGRQNDRAVCSVQDNWCSYQGEIYKCKIRREKLRRLFLTHDGSIKTYRYICSAILYATKRLEEIRNIANGNTLNSSLSLSKELEEILERLGGISAVRESIRTGSYARLRTITIADIQRVMEKLGMILLADIETARAIGFPVPLAAGRDAR